MTIRYQSTRGQAPLLTFEEVVLTGLASDGGLYVPEAIPHFAPAEIAGFSALSYPELAVRVMQPFVGQSLSKDTLTFLARDAYASFRHAAIAPLRQLGSRHFLLELFHGPTLAFKDFALQFLGKLLEHLLVARNESLTVIGATSGDTGSAAIEGCRGKQRMRIFILHPKGRVSDVQRRQMTTIMDDNVFNLAIEGTFDDCQDIVKSLFSQQDFREKQRLTAVNSINWARILAQVVYYFYAAAALGTPARALRFAVPTGNFGDIYAGHVARLMGLPIEKLIIASNTNDILTRCLETGVYGMAPVVPTLSPSMDIQISSNFERLLFDLYDRNGALIATQMQQFRQEKTLRLSEHAWSRLRRDFAATRASDEATVTTQRQCYKMTGEVLDPHTAVGVYAAEKFLSESATPMVTLATAHPTKFPAAVREALGIEAALPPHLVDLMQRKERMTTLPADVAVVRQFIESHS